MNSVDGILLSYKRSIDQMAIKQGPKSDDIYQYLCELNSSNTNLEKDVSKTVSFVDAAIKKYVGLFLKNGEAIDINYSNKNQGQYLKHINIYFHKHLPSTTETIKIYLSIIPEYYNIVTTKIYQYLLDNKMNFNSRLAKLDRNDNFIVALYNKKNIIKLITYINETHLSDYLRSLNPFIYQINKIGIVKDVKGLNYNKYVSEIVQEYIEECILNQQANPYTSSDFQQYVARKYNSATNYKERLMSYNLACFLFSIMTGDDIFKRIKDEYPIVFDRNKIEKYQLKKIDKEYHFFLNNEEVNQQISLELKASLCLYHLLLNKQKNIVSYQLNSEIVHKMLEDIEKILSDNICNIYINYTDKNIHNLIPYLYAFIAHKYKMCDEKECQNIISIIKKRMTVLDYQDNHRYIYYQNNQQIVSSIPLIKNDEGLCAIEYIDQESNFSNITIIKNGKVSTYLNVYIKVDYEILKDNINYYGRLYRNAIANALLNSKRNDKALKERQNDFSAFFLKDDCDEVNKYANVAIIKKIFKNLRRK